MSKEMQEVKIDWGSAACKSMPKDFFYPNEGKHGRIPKGKEDEPRTLNDIEKENAKFCFESGCPIREECYEYALENREMGVWGGASAAQRRTARKKRYEGTRKFKSAS